MLSIFYIFFNKRYLIILVLLFVLLFINIIWLLVMEICGNSDKRFIKMMDIVKIDFWIGEVKYKL